MDCLPMEVVLKIFSYLQTIEDLLVASSVSMWWRDCLVAGQSKRHPQLYHCAPWLRDFDTRQGSEACDECSEESTTKWASILRKCGAIYQATDSCMIECRDIMYGCKSPSMSESLVIFTDEKCFEVHLDISGLVQCFRLFLHSGEAVEVAYAMLPPFLNSERTTLHLLAIHKYKVDCLAVYKCGISEDGRVILLTFHPFTILLGRRGDVAQIFIHKPLNHTIVTNSLSKVSLNIHCALHSQSVLVTHMDGADSWVTMFQYIWRYPLDDEIYLKEMQRESHITCPFVLEIYFASTILFTTAETPSWHSTLPGKILPHNHTSSNVTLIQTPQKSLYCVSNNSKISIPLKAKELMANIYPGGILSLNILADEWCSSMVIFGKFLLCLLKNRIFYSHIGDGQNTYISQELVHQKSFTLLTEIPINDALVRHWHGNQMQLFGNLLLISFKMKGEPRTVENKVIYLRTVAMETMPPTLDYSYLSHGFETGPHPVRFVGFCEERTGGEESLVFVMHSTTRIHCIRLGALIQ